MEASLYCQGLTPRFGCLYVVRFPSGPVSFPSPLEFDQKRPFSITLSSHLVLQISKPWLRGEVMLSGLQHTCQGSQFSVCHSSTQLSHPRGHAPKYCSGRLVLILSLKQQLLSLCSYFCPSLTSWGHFCVYSFSLNVCMYKALF